MPTPTMPTLARDNSFFYGHSRHKSPVEGVEVLGRVFTGVGPFLHDDPDNRPDKIFDNKVTLHVGPDRSAHVLLPIIPEK